MTLPAATKQALRAQFPNWRTTQATEYRRACTAAAAPAASPRPAQPRRRSGNAGAARQPGRSGRTQGAATQPPPPPGALANRQVTSVAPPRPTPITLSSRLPGRLPVPTTAAWFTLQRFELMANTAATTDVAAGTREISALAPYATYATMAGQFNECAMYAISFLIEPTGVVTSGAAAFEWTMLFREGSAPAPGSLDILRAAADAKVAAPAGSSLLTHYFTNVESTRPVLAAQASQGCRFYVYRAARVLNALVVPTANAATTPVARVTVSGLIHVAGLNM